MNIVKEKTSGQWGHKVFVQIIIMITAIKIKLFSQ